MNAPSYAVPSLTNVRPPTDVIAPSSVEPMRLKLQIVSGPDFGAELRLEPGTHRIGKEEGNELVLRDNAV